MKKFFSALFLIVFLGVLYLNREFIVENIVYNIVKMQTVSLDFQNSYNLQYDFDYVQNVKEFNINNKQDLMNLYYTVINNGNEVFDLHSINLTMNPSDALKNFPLTRVKKDDAE